MKEKIYSIGIDVSKKTLDICLMGINMKVLKVFKTINSAEIVTVLNEQLAGYELDESACVILESTSSYHLVPALCLKEKNYKVKVINPLVGFKYNAGGSIRNCKTDRKDSIKLAEIGIRYDHLPLFETTLETIELKKKISMLSFFLKREQAAKASIAQLKETFGQIGIETGSVYTTMQEALKADKEVIKKLNKEIKESGNMLKGFDLLSEIKGVSDTSASIILGNIIDKDFQSKNALTSFLGLDVNTKQSGTSINGKGRISKKGNNAARGALLKSVWGLMMHNDKFKELNKYYKAKGKTYKSRLVILGRKLLHIIFGMLKNNSHFDSAKIIIPTN